MKTKFEVRQGSYYDSIVLMQLQRRLSELEGVADAAVVMATEANKEMLRASGFDVDQFVAYADDLVIMVKGDGAKAAIGRVDELLQKRSSGGGQGQYRPKSLATAAKSAANAQWVLISVPGRYAAQVAHDALDLGKHVFLYSDNVALEDEVALKQKARAKGLLVMGPDCGTAIIDGVGLGFANRVRRGNVGIVAASGTGLQAVTVKIDQLGGGISQAFGTGGRDLNAAVAGITALQALDYLNNDPDTERIVLISKPPAPSVATQLLQSAYACEKPVIVYFLGYAVSATAIGNVTFARSLTEAALLATATELEKSAIDVPHTYEPYMRGLFSGGTLAYELLLALRPFVTPLYTNIGVEGVPKLQNSLVSQANTVIDLGEDEFTQGRLHPMMDNALRIRRLREEATDDAAGLIVLDVVLGEGAHADPTSELAPVIEEVKRNRPNLQIIAIVIGTEADPQGMEEQIGRLQAAGCLVYTDLHNAINAITALIVSPPTAYKTVSPFNAGLSIINVGLETFYDSALEQGAEAIHVEWRPPAGGNAQMMGLLAKLKRSGT